VLRGSLTLAAVCSVSTTPPWPATKIEFTSSSATRPCSEFLLSLPINPISPPFLLPSLYFSSSIGSRDVWPPGSSRHRPLALTPQPAARRRNLGSSTSVPARLNKGPAKLKSHTATGLSGPISEPTRRNFGVNKKGCGMAPGQSVREFPTRSRRRVAGQEIHKRTCHQICPYPRAD